MSIGLRICTRRMCSPGRPGACFGGSGYGINLGSEGNHPPNHPRPTTITRSYARIARCSGHSSYITHLDWSADSRIIQSNCGAYELLYFEAATGKQIRQNQRDAQWATWTCTLGFPVMGVWRDDTDGTDINAVCRCVGTQWRITWVLLW